MYFRRRKCTAFLNCLTEANSLHADLQGSAPARIGKPRELSSAGSRSLGCSARDHWGSRDFRCGFQPPGSSGATYAFSNSELERILF